MAITTLDGALAGFKPMRPIQKGLTGTLVIGRPFSFWGVAGVPSAGGFDTTLNGVVLTAPVAGQIPFSNPSGSDLSYVGRFGGQVGQAGTLILCDRIWHNGGFNITSTSPQSITSPSWGNRDSNGSSDGEGVLLGVEISSATGAGTPTITVGYTNSGGTPSRSGVNSVNTVATSAAGTFYPISLASGDLGVRSVQSLTLSATWTSGTMNLVAYRPIVSVDLIGTAGYVDVITGGMARIFNDSVLFPLFIPSATNTSNLNGAFIVTQG